MNKCVSFKVVSKLSSSGSLLVDIIEQVKQVLSFNLTVWHVSVGQINCFLG